jgi:hypothetical protein
MSRALPGSEGPGPEGHAGRSRLVAALVCLVLAAFWVLPQRAELSWGWDETMHAELPALRMLFSIQEGSPGGALDALLECERYPFAYPLVLCGAQAVFGVSETTCRVTGTLLWCLALFGLFLAGERARRGLGVRAAVMPWLGLAFGALCPLALGYAGTLFLEVPFACFAIFGLRAWLARTHASGAREGLRRDLAAGAWISLCMFTKFNYGFLFALGLALDAATEVCVSASRGGEWRASARRALQAAALPVIALLWWFVLPLPGGFETAAAHRAAVADFLGGNQQLAPTANAMRLLYFLAFFVPTARLGIVLVLGVLLSLFHLHQREVRSLWWVLLALGLPIALHPFHIDRFQIPVGPPLWLLAAVGWSGLFARSASSRVRAALPVALGLVALAFPAFDTPRLAGWLGQLAEAGPVRDYQLSVLGGWGDLSGARRLRSAGLRAEESAALLDLVAGEVAPDERVGWIGVTSEISPAGLHIGLQERGGSRRRFLEEAHRQFYVTFTDVDPGWSDEELETFAAAFDVILATDPVDMKGDRNREFLRPYQEALIERLGWNARRLGRIPVSVPLREDIEVTVYALRRP